MDGPPAISYILGEYQEQNMPFSTLVQYTVYGVVRNSANK